MYNHSFILLIFHVVRVIVTIYNVKYTMMVDNSVGLKQLYCNFIAVLAFIFSVIIVLINNYKELVPQAAGCVFTSGLSASSRQHYNFLVMLILQLVSCCCNSSLLCMAVSVRCVDVIMNHSTDWYTLTFTYSSCHAYINTQNMHESNFHRIPALCSTINSLWV